MSTFANGGDTSLADADSIDAPPRVAPWSSPLTRTAPVISTPKEDTKNSYRNGEDDGLEDIFGSQTISTATSTGRPFTAEEVRPSYNEQNGLTERVDYEASATTGSTPAPFHAPTSSSSSIGMMAWTRVPSKENLYRNRSHSKKSTQHQRTDSPRAERCTPPCLVGSSDKLLYPMHESTSALAEQYGNQKIADGSASVTRGGAPAAVESLSTPKRKLNTTGRIQSSDRDPAATADSLLRRMQNKEKEFDQKIHMIHDTFQNAGEQLVMRDNIIAQLQDELAQLRIEASRIPKDYQVGEEKLLLRVEDMMRELREEQTRTERYRRAADEEVKQLRTALNTADKQLAQQQRVSDDLLRQLRASDKALKEEKIKHAAALQESRRTYEDKLKEFQSAYDRVEKELVKAHARNEEAEKDRAECQARLLEHELDHQRRRSGDTERTKKLTAENDALREDVEAVQLSMTRLLRLMSEVPALADYLQWNELSSEFVFLGYPTRYFANGHARSGNRTSSLAGRGRSPRRQRTESRQTSPARRRVGGVSSLFAEDRSGVDYGGAHLSPSSSSFVSAGAAAPYYQDMNFSGGSYVETGVEDGVYAGIASSLSKNVWLNGRWAQQMMDIIASANNYTRLKRIKLLELEEAAQLTEQLSSARDILEGRQPEHDYWIPYAVFTEAQKFKNKYYPKLPAMSHFYPFLIQLNRIWRAKLLDRLRVRQSDRNRSVGRQRFDVIDSRHSSRRRVRETMINAGEVNSRITSRSATASQLDAYRSEELLNQLVHCDARLSEIQAEHHRLRRDVRLNVSSSKALQLFRQYDELIRGAHASLREMAQLADELHNSNSRRTDNGQITGEEEDGRPAVAAAAVDSLHDVELHAQMKADLANAVDARDHLFCVVERACERVCDVGDSLSTRMVSYYSDLQHLIRILHYNIRQQRSQGDVEGVEASSDNSSDSSRNHSEQCGGSTTQTRREESKNVELAYRIRRALREQYGTAEALANDTTATATAVAPGSGFISVDSLLKLAASVLDFGEEVRKEVTDASAALRNIAEQAMREAEQLA